MNTHAITLSSDATVRVTLASDDLACILIQDTDVEVMLRIHGVETLERILSAGIVARKSMDRRRAYRNLHSMRAASATAAGACGLDDAVAEAHR